MKLFYRDLGGAGKRPLIILHGLFGSSRNWNSVGKSLSHFFHVWTLDLPNHGESPKRTLFTFENMIEDVAETLTDLGLKKVFVIGHSLGGKVAMLLACRHPNLVDHLALVDIGPKEYPLPLKEIQALKALDLSKIHSRQNALDLLKSEIPDLKARHFLLTNLIRPPEGGFEWAIDLKILKRSLEHLRLNPLSEKDFWSGRAQFIVSQKTAYVVPEDEPIIRKHFPNAEMFWLPNVGHNIHIDDPETLIEVVTNS